MKSQQNIQHPIELIYFDEKSEDVLGAFPLDREYYARILEVIETGHPKFVILKFFFDKTTDSDEQLSLQIMKFGNVLTQTSSFLEPLSENTQVRMADISLQLNPKGIPEGETLVLPNSSLFESFLGVGHVDFKTKNGEYMNCPLAISVADYTVPSLALRVGMLVTDSDPIWLNKSISLAGVPLSDSNGNLKISLSEPEGLYPKHSFIDVLESESGEYDFKDKIIIVFVDNDEIRSFSSQYGSKHNPAEIVADSINTVLMMLYQ